MDKQATLKILQECEILIAEDKMETALKKLMAIKKSALRSSVINLSGQLSGLKSKRRDGVVTDTEYDARLAQLRSSLLEICRDMQKEIEFGKAALQSNVESGLSAGQQQQQQQRTKKRLPIILGVLVPLVGIGIWWGLTYGFFSTDSYIDPGADFVDARNNQPYPTLIVANEKGTRWMAQNLNYDLAEAKAYCYDDLPSNCKTFGRLYTWEAARKVCPAGWHLPTVQEWMDLAENYLEEGALGTNQVSDPLSSYDYLMDSEFLPQFAGLRDASGHFEGIDAEGSYWSVNEVGDTEAFVFIFDKIAEKFDQYKEDKESALSVRCVQD